MLIFLHLHLEILERVSYDIFIMVVAENTCNFGEIKEDEETYVPLICQFGEIENLIVFGLSTADSKCPKESDGSISVLTECEY